MVYALVWPLLVLLHAPLATAASVFAGAASEAEAVELAKSVELKALSSADFSFVIKEKRWLAAAQQLLSRAKSTPLDFAAPVRSAVSAVRKELDDLIRALDKSYGEASQVSPAFQWAQNSSHIFFQVKFAQRWNAPGALEVENTSITVSDCCFSFKGFGEHSMIRKEYKLFLQFFEPVVEAPASSWHFAAAGRLVVTVQKAKPRKWERLLRSENVQPENMGIWRDMQEKWKSELASQEDAKMKAARSSDDDAEDEAEDQKVCPPGSFADSKVAEFCPERFLGAGLTWSVLFYHPDSTAKKSVSALWRRLKDIVPAHNKNADVAAFDCSKHTSFCDEHGAKGSSLPKAMRYRPAGSLQASVETAVPFAGEFVLEDLAAWATATEEEKAEPEKKSGKRRRRRRSQKEKKEL